jgi:hypothetical protein
MVGYGPFVSQVVYRACKTVKQQVTECDSNGANCKKVTKSYKEGTDIKAQDS